MKFVFAVLVLLSVFIASVVSAQQPSSNRGIKGESGLILDLEAYQSIPTIDSLSPDNGRFLLVFGTLTNPTSGNLCPYAREVVLTVNNIDYRPVDEAMAAFQQHLDTFRDYIGSNI